MLQGIDGIRFVYFDDRDVVRHDLVSAIIRAYDRLPPGASARRPGMPDSAPPAPSSG